MSQPRKTKFAFEILLLRGIYKKSRTRLSYCGTQGNNKSAQHMAPPMDRPDMKRFVNRIIDLLRLHQALDDNGRSVLVAGPRGFGKTSFVRAYRKT